MAQDQLRGKDYAKQIFVHMLDDCDLVNADIVLRRVHESISKRS